MSAPPEKPTITFNERLNEQLINCLNIQTNVIQNLAQYSQHISLQLMEIKNTVEILSSRVLTLQQQQQQQQNQQASYGPNPNYYPTAYHPNYPPQQPTMPHPNASSLMPHPAQVHIPPHAMPFPFPQHHEGHPPPRVMLPPMTTTTNPAFSTHPTVSHVQTAVPSAATTQPSSSTPTSVSSIFSTSASSTLPSVLTKPLSTPISSMPSNANTTVFPTNTSKASTTDTNTKPIIGTAPLSNNTDVKPSNASPFTFGTGKQSMVFGSSIGANSLPTFGTTKTETHEDEDDESGGEDDSYEPNATFKSIVQLSAVEVKTGEEDENVLFCERAKLYRFDADSNQMKERGIGEMKILQHKETNLCRILMRREQVLKLCANHNITADMELKPHSGSANAFLWSAMDFADGEPKHETLCIRFKTEEQAKKFMELFNEAKEKNSKSKSGSNSEKKASGNVENSRTAPIDDDIIPLGEVKPSAEQADRARQLKLPSTFYLYENKDPCGGCVGCKDESTNAVSNENNGPSKAQTNTVKTGLTTTPTTATVTPASKVPLGSSENIKAPAAKNDTTQSTPTLQKQTSASKTEKPAAATPSTPQPDNKSTVFGSNINNTSGSIFGVPPSSSNSNGTVFGGSTSSSNTNGSVFGATTPFSNNNGPIFGNPTMNGTSIFGGTPGKPSTNTTSSGFSFPGFGNTTGGSTPSTGFTFGTAASTSSANTNTTPSFGVTPTGSGAKPLFGTTAAFSFADLAKTSGSSPLSDSSKTNGKDQRVFAGQGTLVFGNNSLNNTTSGANHDDEDGEGGGEDDSYEPNVSFKPIVQLSAVEVKTGEEDENVLFCERAKLYRFDADSNQMKERGIGEMKILQHKKTNLCRVLMRREQVLKLCANHNITADMELKPHSGSANAFLWSAMDFADGEPKHETLCIRFKSNDQADRFVKQFKAAQLVKSST